MALGTRVFKIHSVSHFAMILSLGCLGLKSTSAYYVTLISYFIISRHSVSVRLTFTHE